MLSPPLDGMAPSPSTPSTTSHGVQALAPPLLCFYHPSDDAEADVEDVADVVDVNEWRNSSINTPQRADPLACHP